MTDTRERVTGRAPGGEASGIRQKPTAEALVRFVTKNTTVRVAELVPEIPLHLATAARNIFVEADELLDGGLGSRPYWAFAWPGGQGLSRYILDHPELVAGKRVLDVGSGSGMGAIAALKAGAVSALACDIDPLADTAARMNATLNAVTLATTREDLLSTRPTVDVVLIGDLVYEPDLQMRVGAFLETVKAMGIPVLYGDRTSARRPRTDFELLIEYEAPLTPPLVDDFIERSRVWRLG
jgi:predicted nicotinamide N-methyase